MPRVYRPSPNFRFPGGKTFAFSVFDDTDVATERSVRPLYDLLLSLGIRTTKTVWSLAHEGPSDYAGSHTLENRGYASFIRDLAGQGVEIAFHGATMESSVREETIRGLDLFYATLGHYPRSYASHARNRDNLYWGPARFSSPLLRRAYPVLAGESRNWFQGHIEGSPYFWGDLSLKHLHYVRGFTFDTSNLWSLTPHVCYEDERTSWVRSWFVSADADNVEEFVRLLDERNQDRLEREGGVLIVSTHLGKGFVSDGKVEPRVRRLLTQIAGRPGWFAPVAEILDCLRTCGLVRRIPAGERRRLEWLWYLHALRRRGRRRPYFKAELSYLGGE